MPDALLKIKDKALEMWTKLDKSQKTRVMLFSGILIFAFALGLYFATKTNYVPLLTVQNPKDIKQVEKILSDKKINYQLGQNGQVMVKDSEENTAQWAIKSEPSLSSSVNFEDTWGKLSMSATEGDKKQLWQNYKKTSLIAQIKMFDNVADADVDLALPEKSSYFFEQSEKPTAYVRITPKGGITQEQATAITRVVAASIEGLKPSDVTVVDNNLNVLTSSTGDEVSDQTNNQNKMIKAKKAELETNIKKLYNGRSDSFDLMNVVVNPILNFDKKSSETNAVIKPEGLDGGALISNHSAKETVDNAKSGGAPGVDSNPGNSVPSYPAGADTGGTYKKTDDTNNYDWTRSKTIYESAVGQVDPEKSSMTVTLWYGDRVTDEKKLSTEFVEQFKRDVSGATGINTDRISINKYKLAPPETVKISVLDATKSFIDKMGYFILLMIIAGLMMFALLRKNREEIEDVTSPAFILPRGDQLADIDIINGSEVSNKLNNLINKDPAIAASLLRNWLRDEW